MGWVFLAGAVGLFGLKVSIFQALNKGNPDVFNSCNILCASQTVGLASSALFLRNDLSQGKARAIPRSVWLWMLMGAALSSVIGALFSNLGWEMASVATVSVLEKSQSVFIIVAQPLLSRCTKFPSKWDTVNALLTAVGITLTFISAALFFRGEPPVGALLHGFTPYQQKLLDRSASRNSDDLSSGDWNCVVPRD